MYQFAQKQHQSQKDTSTIPVKSWKEIFESDPILQRKINNGALHNFQQVVPDSHQANTNTTPTNHFVHDFNRISVHSKAPIHLQPKFYISKAGDQAEQEAEKVTSELMQIPQPNVDEKDFINPTKSVIQTPVKLNGNQLIKAPSQIEETVYSTGQPLERNSRAFFEVRFGHDFSKVRVHTDLQAAESAQAIHALAYTVGQDILFANGQYAPQTNQGKRLLAHELAHVWQNQYLPNPMQIQRYESPEHQDLGDKNLNELFVYIQTEAGKQWAKARGIDLIKLLKEIEQDPAREGKKIRVRAGLELTPGEIIALMGDFYATWQDLQSASRQEIDDILKTMQKERTGSIDANPEYEKITKGRYTKLARINTAHFAPKNKEAWKKLHTEAIEKARKAGANNDENAFQEALFIDAAGGHFLTDAFASGHLFDSAKVEIAIRSYLKNNPIRSENPEMQTVVGGLQMAGLAASLVLKNIHDRMNSEGFEIANNKGMHWKTYGDNHLKNAEETRRIAAYAVFVSRQQITQAKKGESPDANEVLDLLPDEKSIQQATDRAYGYIPAAVKEVTPLIHRNIGMLDTLRPAWYLGGPILPFIGKSMLGTISDPARYKTLEEYEQRKQLDPTTPYPTAPLLRFDFKGL